MADCVGALYCQQDDFTNYEDCITAIQENSTDTQVFCLVHKMDLVPEEAKAQVCHSPLVGWSCGACVTCFFYSQVFSERVAMIKARSRGANVTCFKTSIWDETLYKVGWCVARHVPAHVVA